MEASSPNSSFFRDFHKEHTGVLMFDPSILTLSMYQRFRYNLVISNVYLDTATTASRLSCHRMRWYRAYSSTLNCSSPFLWGRWGSSNNTGGKTWICWMHCKMLSHGVKHSMPVLFQQLGIESKLLKHFGL